MYLLQRKRRRSNTISTNSFISLSHMGSLFSLTLPINILILVAWLLKNVDAQVVDATRLLDHVLRDYAFRSYARHPKTGLLYSVHLPESLSDVGADTVRFRCGSLRRYGAQVKEFNLSMGVTVRPCVERVVVVRQNLGFNWSSIYYDSYNFSGFQLVSPVLGLLAYNASDLNSTSPSEIEIFPGRRPILIDFSKVTRVGAPELKPLCASFGSDGKVRLSDQVSENVCMAARGGHFALVIEPSLPRMASKVSRWRLVVGCVVGGVLGVFLLGLLFIALVVRVKKRSRMVEMERRAYEEEALQMSMVGHVRVPTAAMTRTLPTFEPHHPPP